MSEYRLDTYYLTPSQLNDCFGSNDQDLCARVLKDESEVLQTYANRFSGITLQQAVEELINGKEQEGEYPYHYGFATWAIIAEVASSRPENESIGYPFVCPWHVADSFEKVADRFPLVSDIFQKLDCRKRDEAIAKVHCFDAIPSFAFVLTETHEALKKELQLLRGELEDFPDWADEMDDDVEELEDLFEILDEAISAGKNLILVMEGDL